MERKIVKEKYSIFKKRQQYTEGVGGRKGGMIKYSFHAYNHDPREAREHGEP